MWTTIAQLHIRFYGSKEELEKTATVILQTGLSVCTSADSTTKYVANSYTPNSTAARRNWRRQPQSSCRLDSQFVPLQTARQNMWPTATHQTLRQQGVTVEDSHIDLADWTLSVVGTSVDITTKLRGQQLHTRLYGNKKGTGEDGHTQQQQQHSSCRLDFQCSGDREEVENEGDVCSAIFDSGA